ncbi:hypothetical protein A2U01_0053034, partial [Trifolium medium]|nr:hypothetical protein [Trifolium medium]
SKTVQNSNRFRRTRNYSGRATTNINYPRSSGTSETQTNRIWPERGERGGAE